MLWLTFALVAQTAAPTAPDERPPAPASSDPSDAAAPSDLDRGVRPASPETLRGLRGKRLIVRRVDGGLVRGGLLEVGDRSIIIVDDAGARLTIALADIAGVALSAEPSLAAARPDRRSRPPPTAVAVGGAAGGLAGCLAGGGAAYLFAAALPFGGTPALAVGPCAGAAVGAAVGASLTGGDRPSPLAIGGIAAVAGAGALLGTAIGALGGLAALFLWGGPLGGLAPVGGAFVGSAAGGALGASLGAVLFPDHARADE